MQMSRRDLSKFLRNIFELRRGIFIKGFSLFELLICLSIISILLVLTFPNYSQFLSQSKEQSLSQQLLRGINLARSEARLRGDIVGFCGSVDHVACSKVWKDGQIIFVDDDQGNRKVLSVSDALAIKGVLHWRSALGREYLQFLPSGFTNGEQGTFWFCRENSKIPQWAIVVNHAGRTRLVYAELNGGIEAGAEANLNCD